jgi:hypothetical protein
MNPRRLPTIALAIVLAVAASVAVANPIPNPVPASMPLEDMYCDITYAPIMAPITVLWADFTGDYHFSYIPEELTSMKYPLPPDSWDVGVTMDGKPLTWYWIKELYPTILPEWPGIPMIEWYGPFPGKALFNVKFKHSLIRRSETEFIYFYALGTGKYYETYQKEAIAFLDLTMPNAYSVRNLWLDKDPHAFAVTCEKEKTVVSILASARFGPLTHDVIASIQPWCTTADSNNDGLVNVTDLLMVRNSLGKYVGSGAAPEADVNGDGVVNVTDLLMVRNNLGRAETPGSRPIVLRYKVGETISPQPASKPVVEVRGRNLFISHGIFGCCPRFVRMCVDVQQDRVIFREKLGEDPCDCIRTFPVWGTAGPFPPGTYHVEYYDTPGQLLLEKDVTIQ